MIALQESQYLIINNNDIEEKKPFFQNIIECIGVVVRTEAKTLCYHKFLNDSMEDYI